MKDATLVVNAGRDPEHNFGVVNPPIYRASTIIFPSVDAFERPREDPGVFAGERRGVEYGRSGVPTTFALEDAVAGHDGGFGAVITGSGKTAIAQALLSLLEAGNHILMVDSAYAPTRRICERVLRRYGVEITFYDPLIGAGIERLLRPNTRLVYLESPGSLTFEVQDVPAIAEVAHARGALVMLDNTWATGLLFKPYLHGVDITVYAATKYLGGHSDLMMGIVTATEAVLPRLRRGMYDLGSYASPDDCYLALRGLRTMAVRLDRHQTNALRLAAWLQARPEVHRVMCPALPDDPGHALWRRDFLGSSGLFGLLLEPCPAEAWHAFVDGLELFGLGASWGGYESLIMPNQPEKFREATTWDARYPSIRLHAGLEDADDLIADLEQGFARLNRVAGA